MSDMKHWIKFYQSEGIAFMPVTKRSKKPPKGFMWKELQARKMTNKEIEKWFLNSDTDYNIAILGGSVSDNLVIIDVDDQKLFNRLFGVTGTFKYTTAHGGHAIFRSRYPVKSTNLRSAGLPIDIKGEGGYGVAPPSIHENGIEYTGSPQPVQMILGDFMQELFMMIKNVRKRARAIRKSRGNNTC